MKLKTFFISYLLFLFILLATLVTVSIYLTGHHTSNLREQGQLEFERIANTIEREMREAYEREGEDAQLENILGSHIRFHSTRGIEISIGEAEYDLDESRAFLGLSNHVYYIQVNGVIVADLASFDTIMRFDVTTSIEELHAIQRVLLYSFVLFAVLLAIVLFTILSKIFKPLELVTVSTEKIAKGHYDEQIPVKGKNELSRMAMNFNQMAKQISDHVMELQEEAERKQSFIDNLAHELRTPLTSIYGYSQYMQKENVKEAGMLEAAAFIEKESSYMRGIVHTMLELAKLRNYEPDMEQIGVEELLTQVASSLKSTFEVQQVKLKINPCLGQVLGQPDLVKSMLTNLCLNAAKACQPNVGVVELKGERRAERMIRLSIIDNGCGIDEEHLPRLMEPFYQIDASRNKAISGTGLGLAIVKEIASIHQIEVSIESEVGVGTQVKLDFTSS